MWTKGGANGENLVILGINQCRPDEEGEYKCILKNEVGEETFDFKVFVTGESEYFCYNFSDIKHIGCL